MLSLIRIVLKVFGSCTAYIEGKGRESFNGSARKYHYEKSSKTHSIQIFQLILGQKFLSSCTLEKFLIFQVHSGIVSNFCRNIHPCFLDVIYLLTSCTFDQWQFPTVEKDVQIAFTSCRLCSKFPCTTTSCTLQLLSRSKDVVQL